MTTTLQNQLAERRSEADAWRSYRFSALTRLYEVYEPLRFQLAGTSAQSANRIISLLTQDVSPRQDQESPRYRLRSTIYYVLVPSALFRLMEHRLTLVDLRLDPKLNAEYFLIHSVCTSFTHDALLAGLHPKLAYTPYVSQWREKREVDPRTFRRQGLPLGRLDNSLDALITTEAGGQRLATFGEFEERLRQVSDDDVSSGLGAARDLLSDFRPSRRPVLARILVVQLLLYAALRRGLYEEKADYLSLVTNALESVSHVADLFALHEPALTSDGPKRHWLNEPDDEERHSVCEALEPALQYIRDRVLPEVHRIAAPRGT